MSSSSAGASRDQSQSTSPTRVKRARSPTFREPPTVRPAAPVRASSGVPAKKASPRNSGYLDPPVQDQTRKAKGKGKEKAKNQGGRRYVAIAASAEEDEGDQLDEERPEKKVGLDPYERALWRWVNVEDLDGYLQEVSCQTPGAEDSN